ncbi:unnamed protein product [Phyllotreta striolata]|uniref:Programmed cell death protein 2 C-terminal domain-containing protein n=1 Tax=Phyllotreta striolata TaxID=444603 RepID=A0A9N9TD55_PHYSR|nr:unnamed protein product [Phyllotreta striolata]
MEYNKPAILLGFDDEPITEKHRTQVNFSVNKIGGMPDYPLSINLDPPICNLCQLPRPLIVQVYAPLENSTFHRTLYLFACINPNCWNLNESWICLRVQSQEKITDKSEETSGAQKTNATDWCADADDWDDENNANLNEENGNLISNMEKVSDEDEEESCSLEDSLRSGFGNLSVDDRNANKGAQGGAVGRLHSPPATAEIEGNEGEVISIDTPTFPQRDIASILQEAAPVPHDICRSGSRRASLVQFSPCFVAVWEESNEKLTANITDRHVKDLLQEYQQKHEENLVLGGSPEGGGVAEGGEGYEKSHPAHGDKMFHHFLTKIQSTPGQILRYGRESSPLLLYPIQESQKKCQYCQGDLVFEFQLIPTIISKLRLVTDAKQVPRLEFGTVLVYTCRKSCWASEAAARVETVIMQSEVY